MVCGGVEMTHQTSDTTEHNSEAGINFGVMDTQGHTTLHQIEEGESMPNSWLPIAATENPPPTQEFVSGRIT